MQTDMVIEAFPLARNDGGVTIHHGMPAAEYHRMPGASASRLAKLAISPAHLRYDLDHPSDPTPAMMLGTATHTLVLEQDQFAEAYAVAEQCTAITGKGSRCTNGGAIYADWWLCGVHSKGIASAAGKIILTQDHFDRAHGMAAAIKSHPAASLLLSLRTSTEASVTWIDRETGVPCKMRTDGLISDSLGEQLIDLKTTSDASEAGFWSSVKSFDYDLRGAFYRRGMEALGRHMDAVYFLMVESEPPHGIGVYEMPDDLMAIFDRRIPRLLETWAKCEASGVWPGYSEEIQRPVAPAWLVRQREESM